MNLNWFELEKKALDSVRPMTREEKEVFLHLVALETESRTASGLRRRLANLLVDIGARLDPDSVAAKAISKEVSFAHD
jgi:hypothetical protein